MTFDKNKLLAPQTAISIRGLKHSDFKPHMILGDVRVCIAENDGRGGATDFHRTQTIKKETWSEFMPLLVREANRIMPLLWEDEEWFTSKDLPPYVRGNSAWSSNLECVVAHLINEELSKKEMLRRMKNKLLTYDTKDKRVYARKIKLDPKQHPLRAEKVKQSLNKSSPNEIILNLIPEEEALQMYLS